ncbi:MAG: glycosyltransferase family 9 protein [Spirochaetes bacterium]|nr:glycosyltransferase family 9 protein [Spirochaetota bacterium]
MKPLNERFKKLKKIKILIIRLKPIGDTILISPVFRNLKKLYPQCEIDLIIYPFAYDAIKNNPHVDKIIILKRSLLPKLVFYFRSFFKYYHVIIDYINNPTSTMIALFTHAKVKIGNRTKRNFFYNFRIRSDKREYSSIRCLRLLEPLGLKDMKDHLPEMFLDEKDRITADRLLIGLKIKDPIIAIFVSAKYPTRQYTSENFARLGELIINKANQNVLFLFGKDDNGSLYTVQRLLIHQKNVFFISPQITIGELGALLSKARYLITNDTGPKHMATALGVPTLTIFGATDDQIWNLPDTKKNPVIRKKLSCAPCNKLTCPLGTLACMKDLAPEDVFKAFQKNFKS